jgi:hypothetical protein
MRGPINLKSKTYTEVLGVDVAVMNVEVSAHYPGRSPLLPMSATVAERRREGGGEVSRGHSRRIDPAEGPNRKRKKGAPLFR